MTDTSARLALPLILPGQAQKELFHNEALTRIDLALGAAIQDVRDSPPDTPTVGACWRVGATPSGAWIGHAGELAGWTEAGWRFIAPFAGMMVWRMDEQRYEAFDGDTWQSALPVGGIQVAGLQVVGPRQPAIANPSGGATIDVEARSALSAIVAALMSHGLIE